MDPIFQAYLAAQARRRCSPLTLKAVAHALRSAQRWLDEQEISAAELSLLQCEQYFDQLLERGAISTAHRHLAYLRAAYRHAVRHDLVERDPTAEVKLPPLPDIEPATYTNEQLRDIHAAIRCEREEATFFLFAYAGLRLGELAALSWQHVDLAQRQLRLTGKGGKRRLVPLHPVLQDVLKEHCGRARSDDDPVIAGIARRPLAAPTLGRAVRTLVDRADVEVDMPSHAFRRTVATIMYEQGVRTRVIERIMGWAPRKMHERHYLRIADEPMRDAILTLYRDDPICDRHTQALPSAQPDLRASGWLEHETARIDALEQLLSLESN